MHVGKVKFLKLFLLVGGVWIFLYFCEETFRWYMKHEVKPRDTRAVQSMVPTDAKTVHASIPDHKESALLTIEKVAKPLIKSRGDNINNRTGAYLQGSCIKGFVQKKFREFMPSFDRHLHMFITNNYRKWGALGFSKDKLPFDFSRKNLFRLNKLLTLLPNNGHPITKKSDRRCRRCLVLGSSGVLLGKGLGRVIDSYDVVIRMNDAPVKGYESDVGSRTDFRFFYPESSTLNQADLDPGAHYVVVMYKSNDLHWLQAILTKVKPSGQFWKEVAQKLGIDPAQFLILNPQVLRVAAREHVRLQKIGPT